MNLRLLLTGRRLRAGKQFLPGEIRRLAGHHRLDGVGRDGERTQHGVEGDLFQFDAGQAHLQHFDQAAQARIGRQLGDQRLRLGQLPGDLLGFFGRQEQKPVAAEEFAAARLRD